MVFSQYLIIFFLFVIVIIFVDYIKNAYKFELLIERLFRNFLRIEKTAIDFSKNFFNALCDEMRKVFLSDLTLFFSISNGKLFLRASSVSNKRQHFKIKTDILNEVNLFFLSKSDYKSLQILKNKINAIIFRKPPMTILVPTIRNNKLTAFFILCYFNLFSYMRAAISLLINSKKLNEVIYDLINVLKNREQDIGSQMLLSVKDYAFITVDVDLNITTWNKGAEIMFGFSMAEAINKNFNVLIENESQSSFNKAIEISEKTEEVKSEILMKDNNETTIVSEILIKRIFLEDVCTGYYILVKDITKEDIWKKSIRRQAVINKSIVENARDGMLLLNEENRITFLNEKVKNIVDSGITYLGMEINQIFSREYGEKFKSKINELKNSETELTFLNLKFGDLWYNIRFFPIKSVKAFEGVVIFFIDNTYIMKTREKLEEMNRNLIEDLQAAKLMHLNLIPAQLPRSKKIKFQAIFMPSDEVGGDFYYVDEVDIKKRKYYITLLADVSGHGVGASMLTVLVKDVYTDFKINLEYEGNIKLSDFIVMLNKKIINLNMEGSRFVTVFILMLDLYENKIKYSSAGHPHAVILRENTDVKTFGIKNSPPAGIIADFVYTEEEGNVLPRDKIFVYSDGILDVFSYEAENLINFLKSNKELDIKKMRKEIEKTIQMRKEERYEAGRDRPIRIDDITMVLSELF